MTQRLSYLTVAFFLLLGQLLVVPDAYAARDFDWNILLMGNSLVRGIKRPLGKILANEGLSARIKAAAPGIEDLQYHAQSSRTQGILDSKPWDVVFLQQKSTGLAEADGGYAAVRTLVQKINRINARPVMFMTWKERNIVPTSPLWDMLRGDPGDTIGYVSIAHELGIGVAPVGWAVREARIKMGNPAPWDLWKGGKGRHLSDPGQYLAACVVYSVLTGESPRGLWAPETLPPQTADFLQTVAEEIINKDAISWNLLD